MYASICFAGHKSAPSDMRSKGSKGDVEEDGDSLIAFPNDRYASVRPTQRGKRYKLVFVAWSCAMCALDALHNDNVTSS